MISWHKPGQKIACIGDGWKYFHSNSITSGPESGAICTIDLVGFDGNQVCFRLKEYSRYDWYAASRFRPIYPTVIDQLRKLDVPLIERVKEDA